MDTSGPQGCPFERIEGAFTERGAERSTEGKRRPGFLSWPCYHAPAFPSSCQLAPHTPVGRAFLRCPSQRGPGLGAALCGISEDRGQGQFCLGWGQRSLVVNNKADEMAAF